MSDDLLSSTTGRTLRLIELLLTQPDGLGPQELTEQLDVSRSTLFELLKTLKNLGYVEQSEKRGRYRPGPRLQALRLSGTAVPQDILSAFYEEVNRQVWGETFLLVTPTGDSAKPGLSISAQVEGSQRVRSVYQAGSAEPGQLCAAAEVLPAEPGPEVIAHGYSLCAGPEVIELALPVCPSGSRPEAALLVSAPAFRWQPADFLAAWLPELRAMAARLSHRLGAPFYAPFRAQSDLDLQVSSALSPAEMESFLQGPWAARLACIRPDGRPHVIPVWHEWDGQRFTVIAWQGSQWSDFLLNNPNVSLTIDEPWPPLRRVVARGKAEVLPHLPASPALQHILARLSRRYLGQSAISRLPGQVERAFTITPENLRGWQGLPGMEHLQSGAAG